MENSTLEEMKEEGKEYSSLSSAKRALESVRNHFWSMGAASALYEDWHYQWIENGMRTRHAWIDTNRNDKYCVRLS
jgi:hypothetical protein